MIIEKSTLHLLVLSIHGKLQTTEAKERAKTKERARTQERAKTKAKEKILRLRIDLNRHGNPVLAAGIKDDGSRIGVLAGIRDGAVRAAHGRATRAVTNGK